jgi:cytidylate kinase
MKRISIAIDGPVGAGKSTVARMVAERLGYEYVDTGAMYRALGWKAVSMGIPLSEEDALLSLLDGMRIRFEGGKVILDGEDITERIRAPEVGGWGSIVATHRKVRERMVEIQREMGSRKGVVMEGRDIGTVVMPDAELKIYLDASLEERGRRRFVELRNRGYEVDLEEVMKEIRERDNRDMGREWGALKMAEDAVYIDSTGMGIEDVVSRIEGLANKICEG